MARTINDIANEMRLAILADIDLVTAMELDQSKTFDEQFSKADPLRLITYIVAVSVWVLEVLFDKHKSEVSSLIAELKPHSQRWYVNKAKSFLFGVPLIAESDQYDTSTLTDVQITEAQIVKYAAVEEINGELTLKVAAETGEELNELDEAESIAFTAYMAQVKDAGVNLVIINLPADRLIIHATIYYDPLVLNGEGARLDGASETVVEDAIKEYLRGLPFNGQFVITSLVDKLQATEGLTIPLVNSVQSKAEFADDWTTVTAKHIATAGYFVIQELNVTYEPNI